MSSDQPVSSFLNWFARNTPENGLTGYTDMELRAELARRRAMAGMKPMGRPKKMEPCRVCGTMATARQRRGMDGGAPCGHRFPQGKLK